jgi:hypothetical protein
MDDVALEESPEIIVSTLFHVALSHGPRIDTQRLDRWAYFQFFEEAGLSDSNFSDTGVSKLMLRLMWDKEKLPTSEMDEAGFLKVIAEVARRCFSAMGVPTALSPTARLALPQRTVDPDALEGVDDVESMTATTNAPGSPKSFGRFGSMNRGSGTLLQRGSTQKMLPASAAAAPSTSAPAASGEEALRFTIDVVFADYLRGSIVRTDLPFTIEGGTTTWSGLTRHVVHHAICQAMDAVERFFVEFAGEHGVLNRIQFGRMIEAMGSFGALADDELLDLVFVECNTEDTRGIEVGTVGDHLELDEAAAALNMLAFAVYGDDVAFPRHATVQSRIFQAMSSIVAAAQHRYGLPRGAIDDVHPEATRVAVVYPATIGIVFPTIVDLSEQESFFVAGVHLQCPIMDMPPDPNEQHWDELLGRRAAAPFAAKLRAAILEREGHGRGRQGGYDHMSPPMLTISSSPKPPTTGRAASIVNGAASPAGLSLTARTFGQLDATLTTNRSVIGSGTVTSAASPVRGGLDLPPALTPQAPQPVSVMRDAQWLCASNFDAKPQDTLAARTAPPQAFVWCGDRIVEALCIAKNRLQAMPVPSCAASDMDSAVLTCSANADRIEIGCRHVQRVLVQLSRTRDAPQSKAAPLLLCRGAFQLRSLPKTDATAFTKLFESLSRPFPLDFADGESERAVQSLRLRSFDAELPESTQPLMSLKEFLTAIQVLGVPQATSLPRFAQGDLQRRRSVSAAAWTELFNLFAITPGSTASTAPVPKAPSPLPPSMSASPRNPTAPLIMGQSKRREMVRDSVVPQRRVIVELDAETTAKIVFKGPAPRNLDAPALGCDGFLLCVLYGCAGTTVGDQRNVNAEALCIRLRALLSQDRVRKHFAEHLARTAPPPPVLPVAPAPPPPPPESIKSPGKKKGGKGKGAKGKKGRKKSPVVTAPCGPLGPTPVFLEIPKCRPVSPLPHTDVEYRMPTFVKDAEQRVLAHHPPSQNLRLRLYGSTAPTDSAFQTPLKEQFALSARDHPRAVPILPDTVTPRRLRPTAETGDSDQPLSRTRLRFTSARSDVPSPADTGAARRDDGSWEVPLLANTTASREPLDLATPRRGAFGKGLVPDLSPLDTPSMLNVAPVNPSAVPRGRLHESVTATSRVLKQDHFAASMNRVRNHPQYTLKGM